MNTVVGAAPAQASSDIVRAVRWPLIPTGFILAYASGAIAAMLIRALGWWPGAGWEHAMLHAAQRTVNPLLDRIMLTLPIFGTNYSLGPIVAIVAVVLWRRRLTALALHLAIVQAGSWLLNPALKFTFPRDRPTLYEQRGQHAFPAFPSGHAIAVVSVMFTAALLLYKYKGQTWGLWAAGAFFLLNSYSRVYLSVHWPTDVIVGTVVGLVWMLFCWVALQRAHQRQRQKQVQ
ncbi:MAG: phosphatase PAP2 family protein [Gemmatimonadota bacterium]